MSEVLQPEPERNEKSGEVDSGERRDQEGVVLYHPAGVDLEVVKKLLAEQECGRIITLPHNMEFACYQKPTNKIWLVRYCTFCMIVVVARDEAQAKERYYNWLRDNDFIGLHTAACLSDFYDLMVSELNKDNWKLLEVGFSTLPDDKHYIDISLLNEVDNG